MRDALYHDAALAQFYEGENGWAEDTKACLELALGCQTALDLG